MPSKRAAHRSLLELAGCEDLEQLAGRSLAVALALTDASRGCVEIGDPADAGGAFATAEIGCDASKYRVASPEAADTRVAGVLRIDSTRERAPRREPVVRVPIGRDEPFGFVCVVATGGAPDEREAASADLELVAGQVELIAERLLTRRRESARIDATRELRRRYQLDGVIGRSQAFADVLREAMLAAQTDISVLVSGEPATGKRHMARCIHANSSRSGAPLLEIDGHATPVSLIDEILSGWSKPDDGSAGSSAPFDGCGAGTLVIHRVGELPPQSQRRLLEVLHAHEPVAIGGADLLRARPRIIATTDEDLKRRVWDGSFREDLYYRINVVRVRMPSLGERRDDVADLAAARCRVICEREGIETLMLSPTAKALLTGTDLTGNIAQLDERLSGAVLRALASGSPLIMPLHLSRSDGGEGVEPEWSYAEATRRFQRDLLCRTLAATGWNVASAARRLGLARSHVYNLIKTFELERAPDTRSR